MARNAQDNDGLKEAARRSSDVMGAFAARRHSGAGTADFKSAERAAAAARNETGRSQSDSTTASRDEVARNGLVARHEAGRSRSSDTANSQNEAVHSGSDAKNKADHPRFGRVVDSRAEAEHRRPGARTRLGGEERSAHAKSAKSKGRARGRHAKPTQNYPKTLGQFIGQNGVFILGVFAVVVVVVIVIAVLRMTMPQMDAGNQAGADAQGDASSLAATDVAEQSAGAGGGAVPSYDYDWGKLEYADGRYAYVVNGKVKSRTGIDISDHQPGTDWEAVAGDGIDFAIVRLGYRGATEGVIHLDEQFEANIDGAQSAGLDCGVYFFSQAVTTGEAVEEADFVIKSLDGRKLQYPVVYDFETSVNGIEHPRTEKLSADQLVEIANAFRKRIEDAGYNTMLYGNGYDLDRYTADYLDSQAVWWAEYGPEVPTYGGAIAMWQYTSGGEVAGVNGGADVSVDLRGVAG